MTSSGIGVSGGSERGFWSEVEGCGVHSLKGSEWFSVVLGGGGGVVGRGIRERKDASQVEEGIGR